MKKIYEGDRKEQRRQAQAAFRATDPERSRKQWREYKMRKLLERTNGKPKPPACEVCGEGGKICFDHDHQTGVFRGWLCNNCNMILGKVKDSAKLLRDLAAYLEK